VRAHEDPEHRDRGRDGVEVARRLAERVKDLGWHVQFLLDVEDYPDLDRVLGSFATEVVIDHMGRPDPRRGVGARRAGERSERPARRLNGGRAGHSPRTGLVGAPGFQALIRLLRSGRGWAKLSAPYRTSRQEPPYDDLAPFAHALVEAASDRLVWGSDWPHVLLDTTMPNDGDLVDQIAIWVPDEDIRRRILVDNAERLYGFERP